jgi:hypothetical protein
MKCDEHALDFALHLLRLFRSAMNRACHSNTHVQLMLFSLNACLIIARVSVALFSEIYAQSDKHSVGFIAKSHQVRYTTPNKWTPTSPLSCVKFCALNNI